MKLFCKCMRIVLIFQTNSTHFSSIISKRFVMILALRHGFAVINVIFSVQTLNAKVMLLPFYHQHDTSDILFSPFKNTLVMKSFICFTDIFIYKQFTCHEFIKKSIFGRNIDNINNF